MVDDKDEPDHDALFYQALTRPITEDDVYFLLGKYPYLELGDIKSGDHPTPERPAEHRRAKNGWIIHDHGNILRAAQSELASYKVYGTVISIPPAAREDEDEDEGGEGVGELTGHGTIVQQFVDTANEMIALAEKRWAGGIVLGGYYAMQRAAWIEAQQRSFTLDGFDATPEDKVVFDWVKRLTPGKKPGKPGPKGN